MGSAICGECNMPPSGCSLGPLSFCGYPTQRLGVSCATLLSLFHFVSFPNGCSGCTKGFLDPRRLPFNVFVASNTSFFGPAEFSRGHSDCRQLGPYRAVCDHLGFSLE